MSVHPLNPPRPDRLTALDIVALTDVEVRAVLIHVAGHADTDLAASIAAEVRAVVEHTRGPGAAAELFGNGRIRLDKDPGAAP